MKMINWRFIKFCIVGTINTAIDTTSFVLLRLAELSLIGANLISTSLGITASYFLNTRYTFKTQALSKKQIFMYFGITLLGLWVVQPAVIALIMRIEEHFLVTSYLVSNFSIFASYKEILSNLIPKIAGVVISVVWNYTCYSRIVFK
jgi:putative flippase GtrA